MIQGADYYIIGQEYIQVVKFTISEGEKIIDQRPKLEKLSYTFAYHTRLH